MKKMNVHLSEDIAAQYQAQAADKSISVSEYLRDLIALGHEVETLSKQDNEAHGAGLSPTVSIEKWLPLIGHNLKILFEIRYLIRHLTVETCGDSDEIKMMFDEIKARAQERGDAQLP